MEAEIIRETGRYYYDGELTAGKLLSKSGANEITVNKFNSVMVAGRVFLLNPVIEEFVNLQFRDGKYEYIYKSGENFIVRDEDGNEIMPKEWVEKGLKVLTTEGIGIVETFGSEVALVKSATGLKNYYIKNLKPADPKTDYQKLRNAWKLYEEVLPMIKSELRADKTKLLKGAFDESFKKMINNAPKPELPPTENIEPVKAEAPTETPAPAPEKKTGILGKVKDFFSKPKDVPKTPEPPSEAEVNVNHNLPIDPPKVKVPHNNTNPEHLEKQHQFVHESNMAGTGAEHKLTHIDLNPNAKSDKDKYLYHYEVGDHKDPIVTDKYLDPSGHHEEHYGDRIQGQPGILKNGIYVPGESVIDKTTGEQHEVLSHIDHNPNAGVTNYRNMLVKDRDGKHKSIDRNSVQLASADRTTHSIVNTEGGNKHLHNLKVGDTINHEGNQHEVLFSDHKKGLATVDKQTGKMNFVSAQDYHKPYLGEVKPVVKEGHTVQIGKKQYKVEHVGGDDKGMSILSTKDKLGNVQYFEHPTEKLHDKILKPADLQDYKGGRFDPKKKAKFNPEENEHTKGIVSAEDHYGQKVKHPDLSDDDMEFLTRGRGLRPSDINKMTPEEVQGVLSKKKFGFGGATKAPEKTPLPETPMPKPAADEIKTKQDEQKQKQHDAVVEHLDGVFGEHNKTTTSEGTTHRLGVGGLGLKTINGHSQVVNPEVPYGKDGAVIVKDIDPVNKKVLFRVKGKDAGDKKSYKSRSFEDFKTLISENEKVDKLSNVDIANNQTKHEGEFQNKAIKSIADHMHENGIEPTKENIENELKTVNSPLRQKLEGAHTTYERNHNKAKSGNSIVDHPEYDKLDMDKTISKIHDLEGNVKEHIGKRSDIQRGKIKDELSTDIAQHYFDQGKEYDNKPDAEATHEDFAKHRNMGGTDDEIHAAVKEKLDKLNYNKGVEDQRAGYNKAREDSEKAAAEKENMQKEDYLNTHYRSKPDIVEKSVNKELGLESKRNFDVVGDKEHDQMEFEDHIVPLSSLTASHTPHEDHINHKEGAEKTPMVPNVAHPSRLQGRLGYSAISNAGNEDRKYTMEVGKDMRPNLLTGSSTKIDDSAPIVEKKGMAINNGRIMGLQTATPESKAKYVEELKKTTEQLFPGANKEELHKKLDEMLQTGDMPVHVRVPKHSSGDYLNYENHPDETSALAKASNDPSIKTNTDDENIQGNVNALDDGTKNKIMKQIPSGISLRQHIQDTGNAKKMLEHFKLTDQQKKLFFDEHGKINDEGKDFLIDSAKELNVDKELKGLADSNGKLGRKFDDFHNKNYEILNDIKTNNKDYDLMPHIKDALKETVADQGQSEGQQKIVEESPVTKGLRYLIDSPEKDGHKKINNFDLDKTTNAAANSIAENHHAQGKEYKGDTKIGKQTIKKDNTKVEDTAEAERNKAAVDKYVKEGGDILKLHTTVKQKIKHLEDLATHQREAQGALERYRDSTKNVSSEMGGDGELGGLGFEAPKDLATPDQTKEKFFKKYADLHDRKQKQEGASAPTPEVKKEKPIEDKDKFEHEEPNIIYESKNDLSSHPEAKKYDKFPDKKVVRLDDKDAFKGIHPDNIMHFNQGNGKYGRVTFIAPSDHKFQKHEQYKKLARQIREEGKDVMINAFKNPDIIAKIDKMKKSFEGEEELLEKSHTDYEKRINKIFVRQGRSISSVAVMNGDKILMGRRRDSDKWTLPGGHAEEGETPEQAGLRELEEETGIKADKLKALGSDTVQGEGKELLINCFRYDTNESTSMKADPDMEVKKWQWIATPISEEILDNLHAKKNVTLQLLGLQNNEKSLVDKLTGAFEDLVKKIKGL